MRTKRIKDFRNEECEELKKRRIGENRIYKVLTFFVSVLIKLC